MCTNFLNLGPLHVLFLFFFFFSPPGFMAREQNEKQVGKFSAKASGICYDSLAQP